MRQIIPAVLLTLIAGPAMAAASDYSGQYELADGRILTVNDNDGKLTAQFARPSLLQKNMRFRAAKEVALTAVGPARFKALSTPLQITFGHGPGGDIAQVSVDENAPAQTLARR